MKRIVLTLFIVLVAFISGFLVKAFSTPSLATASIEEALKKQWGSIGETIHVEPIKNQVVVFSRKESGQGQGRILRADFVQRGFFGWKWVWGGGFGGITGQYLGQVPDIDSPLIWGELQNNEIQKVKVTNISSGIYYNAKIVYNLGTRIWFVFLSSNDKLLSVKGVSENGEVIDSEEIDLTNNLYPDFVFGEN